MSSPKPSRSPNSRIGRRQQETGTGRAVPCKWLSKTKCTPRTRRQGPATIAHFYMGATITGIAELPSPTVEQNLNLEASGVPPAWCSRELNNFMGAKRLRRSQIAAIPESDSLPEILGSRDDNEKT